MKLCVPTEEIQLDKEHIVRFVCNFVNWMEEFYSQLFLQFELVFGTCFRMRKIIYISLIFANKRTAQRAKEY